MRRWNIETGFEKLKSHSFHMEGSRLRGEGKLEVLLAALAIAFAWSYACGNWSVKHIASIKLKKHDRRAHSVFARGLMLLGELLHGVAKDFEARVDDRFRNITCRCGGDGKIVVYCVESH